MIKIGGTGYTGVELLRRLARHPQVGLRVITSRGEAGKPVDLPFGAAFIVYTVGVHFEKFMQAEIRP